MGAGLDFRHENGRGGQRYFVEPVGAGAALVDLDDDGDLDVVLVQGGRLWAPTNATTRELGRQVPETTSSEQTKRTGARVFRNDSDPAAAAGPVFLDITEESQIRAIGYGMGIATGDIDNDGRVDLYFANFGPNQLWRNITSDGSIRFEEVTAAAGVDDPRWSTSATFADLNGDGWLDLYVANYVDFRLANHRPCRSAGGRLDYCGPHSYSGEPDRLFRNRGDGSFEDVSESAGITSEPSSGLGVVAADLDRDGQIDLYVSNDLRRNALWHNRSSKSGSWQFVNTALEAGAAVSMMGLAQASMGVVAGDIDNDGDDDLFMTHLTADTNTLYLNDGHARFEDRSEASGLGSTSLAGTGFGTTLIDIDNDGWLDLAIANGAVKIVEEQALAGDHFPLKQANQLFRNQGEGRFVDVTATAGSGFTDLEVSRGLAVGDVNNDGRSDLLLTNNGGPARLLLNRDRSGHAWIGLRVRLADNGRDALGARVQVIRSDGSTLARRVATDGSYLSANDPRILVGLGSDASPVEVRVTWVDGEVEVWRGLAAGRYHQLIRGHGEISKALAQDRGRQ